MIGRLFAGAAALVLIAAVCVGNLVRWELSLLLGQDDLSASSGRDGSDESVDVVADDSHALDPVDAAC